MKGGLLRNFTRRSLMAQDEPWWNHTNSDWKLAIEHPWAPQGSLTPDYWMDRVLDLCENDLVHQHFGLGFAELMKLDPATFEKIERRVYEFSQKQTEKLKTIAPPSGGKNV